MNYYQLNNSKLDELVGNCEYIWLKYHRTKTESKKRKYISRNTRRNKSMKKD